MRALLTSLALVSLLGLAAIGCEVAAPAGDIAPEPAAQVAPDPEPAPATDPPPPPVDAAPPSAPAPVADDTLSPEVPAVDLQSRVSRFWWERTADARQHPDRVGGLTCRVVQRARAHDDERRAQGDAPPGGGPGAGVAADLHWPHRWYLGFGDQPRWPDHCYGI